jgi:hypothetical protein
LTLLLAEGHYQTACDFVFSCEDKQKPMFFALAQREVMILKSSNVSVQIVQTTHGEKLLSLVENLCKNGVVANMYRDLLRDLIVAYARAGYISIAFSLAEKATSLYTSNLSSNSQHYDFFIKWLLTAVQIYRAAGMVQNGKWAQMRDGILQTHKGKKTMISKIKAEKSFFP